MISASSSSSTKMRQYRHQMKTKVFSGFTNQLKEVLGRLSGSRWCQMRKPSPVYTTATPAPYPGSGPASCAPHSLGLLQGLRILAPPSPLAVSQPPPQSAAQTLPQPFPGKEGTEAKFLGGLRPNLDPRPPTLPPLPPPFLPTMRR